MKQTAVEWLFRQLWDEPKDKFTWYAILKHAKAMHKDEVIDACNQEEFQEIDGYGIHETISKGEQYYNETFKQD